MRREREDAAGVTIVFPSIHVNNSEHSMDWDVPLLRRGLICESMFGISSFQPFRNSVTLSDHG